MLSGGKDLAREYQRKAPWSHVWDSLDLRGKACAQLVDDLVCPLAIRLPDATALRNLLRKIRILSADTSRLSLGPLSRLSEKFEADRLKLAADERDNAVRRERSARLQQVVPQIAKVVAEDLVEAKDQIDAAHGSLFAIQLPGKASSCPLEMRV